MNVPHRYAWAGIAVIVVAVDLAGDQTMSDAFRLASRHPVAGPLVVAAWLALTVHLFGLVPRERDPLSHGIALVKRKVRKVPVTSAYCI